MTRRQVQDTGIGHARCAQGRGFTLIELMIVVAIIALIVTIAIPSYSSFVEKARRADGQDALMNTAQRLERCYTQYGSYDDANCGVNLPLTSPEGHYAISAQQLNATQFTLQAAPQGAQAEDDCETLTLTHTGAQGMTGTGRCW